MLSADFNFGGAVYVTQLISVVIYFALEKIYVITIESEGQFHYMNIKYLKAPPSLTNTMSRARKHTHLLHLTLCAVNHSRRVGELEAVAQFLELLLQDVHMLVTVLHPVTTHLLQSLHMNKNDS